MSQEKLLFVLARHEQHLQRVAKMLSAGTQGRPLPQDAQFHTDEVQSLDASSSDILIELTGDLPTSSDWLPPGRYPYEKEYYKQPGEFNWLLSYQQGLQRSKNFLALHLSTTAKELHMGDKITVGTAQVVVGPGARTGRISMHGSIGQGGYDDKMLSELAAELSTLRKQLRAQSDPENPDHDVYIGAVGLAQKAAASGDASGVMTHLKSAGKWCLDVATKIGVSLATEAIKHATGLGK